MFGTDSVWPKRIIIVIDVLVLAVFALYHYCPNLFEPKCPHGIRGGAKPVRGKWMCPECKRAHDTEEQERLNAIEKKAEIERQERSRQTLFTNDIEQAIQNKENFIVKEINELVELDPRMFEDVVANMYRKLGYTVHQTPYSNDGGKDIILAKDGVKYAVECKRYKQSAKIGRPALQKLYAAMLDCGASQSIFVTTCEFSKDAKAYAYRTGIEMIDGNRLASMMLGLWNEQSNTYIIHCRECGSPVEFNYSDTMEYKNCNLNHKVPNIFWKNTGDVMICRDCGGRMIEQHGRYGKYYRCTVCNTTKKALRPLPPQIMRI